MVQALIILCLSVLVFGAVVGVAYTLSTLLPTAWDQGLDKVALITFPVAVAALLWQTGHSFLIPVLLIVAVYKVCLDMGAWWRALPR